jgi:hydrogenase expression/formation protein HypD
MPYENLLRDKNKIKEVIRNIKALKIKQKVNFMEVCGTHTYTYFRFGLRKIIPASINLISGPGCPICITEDIFIDKAIMLAQDAQNIIVTFGDLIRVQGQSSSLEIEKAKGANIQIVYSPLEALGFARNNPAKRIIFLGVGFETTAPLSAAILKEAKRIKINNFFLLCAHRLIPPAMELLCEDKQMNVDGFICPGHVSAVIGSHAYALIVKKYQKGCVVCGFEPLDMILTIYMLLRQICDKKALLENEYTRVVKPQGNIRAKELMAEVFDVTDASWRGFGIIKRSGLTLNSRYRNFDAERLLKGKVVSLKSNHSRCLCAEVVKGKIIPPQCPQFKKNCSPDNPLGPCMVSFEGSCKIYYEYGA